MARPAVVMTGLLTTAVFIIHTATTTDTPLPQAPTLHFRRLITLEALLRSSALSRRLLSLTTIGRSAIPASNKEAFHLTKPHGASSLRYRYCNRYPYRLAPADTTKAFWTGGSRRGTVYTKEAPHYREPSSAAVSHARERLHQASALVNKSKPQSTKLEISQQK
uniref:Secreted protein n=1 Tax=Plectus sambesii TaxID=2011161 RepID=A0A914VLU9_9BILA